MMRFEAYHSKTQLIGAGVIVGLVTLFGILMVFDPTWVENSSWVRAGMAPQWAAFIFGALLFGVGSYFGHICWVRMTHVGPIVRIDETGLLWTAWSAQPIKWNNIDRVMLGKDTNTPYLKLYFRDPMIDLPDNEKMRVRANADRVSQRAHLYLSFYGLVVDRDILREVVQWYLKQRFDAVAEA